MEEKIYNALIVDDEEDVRNVISRFLKIKGFNVKTASDGAEALELITQNDIHFDYIHTDHDMPNMKGLDLLERIKDYKAVKIFCAGGHDKPIYDKAESLGAILVAKPVTDLIQYTNQARQLVEKRDNQ